MPVHDLNEFENINSEEYRGVSQMLNSKKLISEMFDDKIKQADIQIFCLYQEKPYRYDQ